MEKTMYNVQSSNKVQKTNHKRFDLDERTLKFSQDVIKMVRKLKKDLISIPIISQLIRSATSIGANCSEATEAASKKDFINKIVIAKKEAKETRYWLKLLKECSASEQEIDPLLSEAQELTLILAAIVRNAKSN